MGDGRIMSVDPGLAEVGLAVAEPGPGPAGVRVLEVRHWKSSGGARSDKRSEDMVLRAADLGRWLLRAAVELHPSRVAMEGLVHRPGLHGALSVSLAIGATVTAAAAVGAPIAVARAGQWRPVLRRILGLPAKSPEAAIHARICELIPGAVDAVSRLPERAHVHAIDAIGILAWASVTGDPGSGQ